MAQRYAVGGPESSPVLAGPDRELSQLAAWRQPKGASLFSSASACPRAADWDNPRSHVGVGRRGAAYFDIRMKIYHLKLLFGHAYTEAHARSSQSKQLIQ